MNRLITVVKWFAVIVLSGTLGACNIGDSVSADGSWEGTFTEGGVTADVSGMLYGGRFIAFSETAGAIYDGTYTMSGSNLSGSATAFDAESGEPYATITFSGTVAEQEAISLLFTTSYGSSGSIAMSYDGYNEGGASLARTEGTWAYTEPGYSMVGTVQDDGSFFGQDSTGCTLSGQLSVLDPEVNLYDTVLVVDLCGEMNGEYTGFSELDSVNATDDTLVAIVSNSSRLLFYGLSRQ